MTDYFIDQLIDFSDLLNVKSLSASDWKSNITISIKATVDGNDWSASFTAPKIAASLNAETNKHLNMIKLDDEAIEFSTSQLFGIDTLEPISYEVRLTTSSGITKEVKFRKTWTSKEVSRRCISNKSEGVYEVFDSGCTSNDLLVITMGGSGGGFHFSRQMACLLANHGYTSAALAYFGVGDLPTQLDRIPLEYFRTAYRNIEKHLGNRKRKIVLIGRSRGAELALLLASQFPEISGVIAYAPSGVVLGGFAGHSAWAIGNSDIPYIPSDAAKFESLLANGGKDTPIDLCEYYSQCRAAAPSLEVEIEVENIKGPVLLLSGKDDRLWPSSDSSVLMESRLKEKKFTHDFQHCTFDRVGHCFDIPGLPFFTEDQYFLHEDKMLSLGGEEAETLQAERDSFNAVLGFLKRI